MIVVSKPIETPMIVHRSMIDRLHSYILGIDSLPGEVRDMCEKLDLEMDGLNLFCEKCVEYMSNAGDMTKSSLLRYLVFKHEGPVHPRLIQGFENKEMQVVNTKVDQSPNA